jgi:hypothetical protein
MSMLDEGPGTARGFVDVLARSYCRCIWRAEYLSHANPFHIQLLDVQALDARLPEYHALYREPADRERADGQRTHAHHRQGGGDAGKGELGSAPDILSQIMLARGPVPSGDMKHKGAMRVPAAPHGRRRRSRLVASRTA